MPYIIAATPSLLVCLSMLRSSQRVLQYLHHIRPIQAPLRKMSSSLYTDETPAVVKEAKVQIVEKLSHRVVMADVHSLSGSTFDHPKHAQWAESPNSLGGTERCVQHPMDDLIHQYHDQ